MKLFANSKQNIVRKIHETLTDLDFTLLRERECFQGNPTAKVYKVQQQISVDVFISLGPILWT